MEILRDIAAAECTVITARIDFADERILDIGPYIVWGLMSKDMAPVLTGGGISPSVMKVLEAVRLRRFMGMSKFAGIERIRDVWAFTLRERPSATSTATPERAIGFSKVADKFVDTINEWLGALPQPFELTQEAKPGINKIVTEILDNAERHGRPGTNAGGWYVAGFMAQRRESDRDWHDCHIAFVNLGSTISKTIGQSQSDRIKHDLKRYQQLHATSSPQSADALATLYAMQDGVSALPEGAAGKGMMEMVELTNILGRTSDDAHRPAITVISGRSCIRFHDRYAGCLQPGPDRHRRLQPFNVQQTLNSPPDPDYVYDLDHRFPGTIVALRFSLDHKALTKQHTGGTGQ